MSSAEAVDYAFVNKSLNEQARDIRKDIPMRAEPGALDEYIRCWSEDDVIEGRPCKALVVILKTRGCTWALAGGCTMCGYANESAWQKVSADQLVAQFERAWRKYDGEELVKIYTSGSFVDRHEVMPEAQERILAIIGARAAREPTRLPASSCPSAIIGARAAREDAVSASGDVTPPTAATSGNATPQTGATSGETASLAASRSAAIRRAGSAGPGGEAADPDARPDDITAAPPADTTRSHSEAQPASSEATTGGRKGPGVRKVAFESLPGFIQDDTFPPLTRHVPLLEVGLGVESQNDRILRDSVNKGHGFDAFPRAAAICKEHGVSVKAYLMCKPPFLTEADALADATETIIRAAPYSDVVSLNPTNIQGRTVVDALYKRGSYRAPWLWTLVHSLLEGDAVARKAGFTGILKSDVIAAGQDRGAHNCGRCDDRVVKYLKKFKDTQDRKFLQMCLDKVECPCRNEWELTLELGEMVPAYGL